VLAVLLIVGGAAAAGIVALRLADRTEYAYLGQDIGTGEQIEAGDLRIVSLTADEVAAQAGTSGPKLMTVDDAEELLGWYSRGDYPAGTLVNEDMFVESNEFPAGTAQVGLVLSREQTVSTELGIGDRIEIYSTSAEAAQPATKVGEGTITDIADRSDESSGGVGARTGTHITVQIQEPDLPQVAQAAGNGTVYVAVIAPETSGGGGSGRDGGSGQGAGSSDGEG
jgi:hypothetical protein